MPLTLTWQEIALRLALAALAGGIIGFDRGEHGRPAGLRTTLLVCLAAAVTMIEANLLLGTRGKTPDAFATMDVMRLPLGILTGMGFIGGGAILRRDGFVLGVTTAATLWFVTVVGLCFGAGLIALGIAASALCIVVLSGLRWFEQGMKQDRQGILTLTTSSDQPTAEEIQSTLRKAGYKINLLSVAYVDQNRQRQLEFRLQWRDVPEHSDAPPFLRDLVSNPYVQSANWKIS